MIQGNATTATDFSHNVIYSDSAEMSQLTVNSTVFSFSRTSAEYSLPVMSRLLIGPISNDLNGTVINCVDVAATESLSTTIIIREREALQGIHG